MSPVLFSVFIDDLVKDVKDAELGVRVGGELIPMLLYADDVVLISNNSKEAQDQLDILDNWCKKWMMKINPAKSQIMHVRNPQKPKCTDVIKCGEHILQYTNTYKYLGILFHEHLSTKPVAEILSASASRSFGRIVSMFRKLKNMGVRTYETLCSSFVTPILNYGAGIWGFHELSDPHVLQNRMIRYYLGVHKFAPVPAMQLEMDWLDVRYQRWIEMVRLRNRFVNMEEHRLPLMIHNWDVSLDRNTWANQVTHILQYANMYEGTTHLSHIDLDVLTARLKRLNREKWMKSACAMPKLRTFVDIYDECDHRGLVYANLTRRQRSMVTKLKIGILPLAIETGRFLDVPLEYRTCQICEDNLLEDEYHFLLYCEGLKDTRSEFFTGYNWLEDLEDPTDKIALIKLWVNSHNLRKSAKFIEEMMEERKSLMYDWNEDDIYD